VIGRLSTRFALSAPSQTPDGQGGFVAGWTAAGSTWGRIEASAARTDGDLDGPRVTSLAPVIVRAAPAIGVGWRLVGAGRTFRVAAIDAAALRPGHVRLICQEETP
jgi:head-tail adaptor